jgi:hypothetical protein
VNPVIRRWRWPVVVFAGYLVVAVLIWNHVWIGGHPAGVTTCGCGDPAQSIWSLGWLPYALGHGIDPLFSHSLFAPSGINLLDNTSSLLPALVLSPVTVLFGPIVSFNVALTLAPVVNACCAYAAVRRFSSWHPAAFAGGLLYGFSPFVLTNSFVGHLQFAVLFVPPLLLIVLYETLVVRQWSALRSAASLAALVVAQFFTGTEMLALTALVAVLGVVILVCAHPSKVAAVARQAGPPLLAGAGVALVILAWPIWLLAEGPQHFTGVQHPGIQFAGVSFRSIVEAGASATKPSAFGAFVGYLGDQGPSNMYVGWALAVLLVAGVVVLWRQAIVRWCAALAVLTTLLAGGEAFGSNLFAAPSWVAPWRLVDQLPLVAEATPSHVAGLTMLILGVLFGVILDRGHTWLVGRLGRLHHPATPDGRVAVRGWPPSRAAWLSSAVVCLVAVGTLVPVAQSLGLPATVQPVVAPTGFDDVLARSPVGTTMLLFPFTSAYNAEPLVWQATSDFTFNVVGGYGFKPGPNGAKLSATDLTTGYGVLASLNAGPLTGSMSQELRLARVDGVRSGVTETVVVPSGLESEYAYALAFYTALLGRAPVSLPGGDWVWWGPVGRDPALAVSAAVVSSCARRGAPPGQPLLIPTCVLAAAGG